MSEILTAGAIAYGLAVALAIVLTIAALLGII